ncbi:MAG: hypothetical protein ACK5MD_08910 [Flavobacteriales bacterium]
MEMRLNKILYIIGILILVSCKGNSQDNTQAFQSLEKSTPIEISPNFLDKKYFTGYSLVMDESNIGDHPHFSYLNCNNEGYFTVHFVPKERDLRQFWSEKYYKNIVPNTYDYERDNKKIDSLLKNNLQQYNIFSYLIKKEYLNQNNGCTIESVFTNKSAIAEIYFYNQSNNWELKKTMKSEVLPPYVGSDFFISTFPDLFSSQNKIIKDDDQEQLYSFSHDLNNDGINDKIVVYKNERENDKFAKEHFALPIKIFKGKDSGSFDLWRENTNIIAKNQDTCVSEGFVTITTKNNYFTIEQQTCYDYNVLVNTYLTFVIKNNEIYLHKYGEIYFDKSNHEREIPNQIWTTKDFGNVKFENVTEKFLINLRLQKWL